VADELQRVTTGITGLDLILGGGLAHSAAYIVQGRPGAGKTILANQISFHHAAAGGSTLYVTLLAESHTHLFQNLGTLGFFDRELIPNGVFYVNANRALSEGGVDGLVELLRTEMKRQGSSLLVLDGLLNVRDKAESDLDLKRCLLALQGHAEFAGCTLLMLTSATLDEVSPEHTMVDGIIELAEEEVGMRTIRRLYVRKHRGSRQLRGLHEFEITERGVVVLPRLEAQYAVPSREDVATSRKITSGVPQLDAMLGGGLPLHSASLVMGPSGTGKTTLGLHFLAGCSPEEPGLYFGFYETPARLEAKATSIGIDLPGLTGSGALEILWQPATENLLDALGHRLLDAVERRGVRRLFLDGFAGFQRSSMDRSRFAGFVTALMNELRARGVTTMVTWEMHKAMETSLEMPDPAVASNIENIIMLRFVELRAEIHRLLGILKVRDSAYDPKLREFVITDRGIGLAGTSETAEALLGGFGREPASPGPAS
jgi:circadian clock protein KaiC